MVSFLTSKQAYFHKSVPLHGRMNCFPIIILWGARANKLDKNKKEHRAKGAKKIKREQGWKNARGQ